MKPIITILDNNGNIEITNFIYDDESFLYSKEYSYTLEENYNIFNLIRENQKSNQALNEIRNRLNKLYKAELDYESHYDDIEKYIGCCLDIDEIIDEVLGDDNEKSM